MVVYRGVQAAVIGSWKIHRRCRSTGVRFAAFPDSFIREQIPGHVKKAAREAGLSVGPSRKKAAENRFNRASTLLARPRFGRPRAPRARLLSFREIHTVTAMGSPRKETTRQEKDCDFRNGRDPLATPAFDRQVGEMRECQSADAGHAT